MTTVSKDVFDYFAKLIYDNSGIVYNDGNKDALEKRIMNLADQFGFATAKEFYADCQKLLKLEYKAAIIEKATNNETSFFRDMPVYDNLRKHVLEPLVQDTAKTSGSGQKIRLWSSACSFGQEPYTLAIIMTELCKEHPQVDFEVLASDISTEALAFAKKGSYRQMEIQRGLSDAQLGCYFKKQQQGSASHWQLSRDLQRKVSFFSHNLLNPLPAMKGKFDVVLCRNVLIYFDLETRSKILANLMGAMNPSAHLLLGAAESIPNILQFFDAPKELVSRIYRLKPNAAESAA